eukprot:4696335-Prymnesium_polylepis.1
MGRMNWNSRRTLDVTMRRFELEGGQSVPSVGKLILSPRDALNIYMVLFELLTPKAYCTLFRINAKATHAVRRIYWLSQRAVRNDTEHATRDARHETVAGAAPSFIPLNRPITRQTLPDPPNLPYPTR